MFKYFFVFFLGLAGSLNAQSMLYDDSQWDEANIFLNETSETQFESILEGNPRFEPLLKYKKNSKIRRLSRPVGRLKIRHSVGGFTTCTATLISRNAAITNFHCIPGLGKHGFVTEAKLEMGYYDILRTGMKSYKVDLTPVQLDKRFDFAIVTVNGDPGGSFGWATLKLRRPPEGENLIVVHHPAGRVKHVTRGGCVAGPITNASAAHFAHKCDTLPGSSGAPIFDQDLFLVGIHCCGTTLKGVDAYNFGKILGLIDRKYPLDNYEVETIEYWLNEHGEPVVEGQPIRKGLEYEFPDLSEKVEIE